MILLVSNNFPPVIDGVGDYTFHLFNHLNKKGVNAKVVCSNKLNIAQYINEQKFNNSVFPLVNKWNFKQALQIVKVAKREKADTILLEYVPYSFSKFGAPFFLFFIFCWARLNRIRTAIFFHEVAVRVWGYGINYFIRGLLQRTLAWMLCMVSNNVFSNTKFGSKLLKPFNAKVLPVPSNLIKEFDGVAYEIFTPKNGIVSFVNRCNETLLLALQELRKNDFPDLKLYLIGKSSALQMQEVNSLINKLQLTDAVQIIDDSKSEILVNVIAHALVYIQLEKVNLVNQGGISTKSGAVMAAMSIGVPIITTVGDMTDESFFINQNNVIALSANANSIMLAQVIEQLIKDQKLALSISMNANAIYTKAASWDVHSQQITSYLS